MLNFINTGLDEATLESVKPYTQDNDLIKAMSKQGLVQREITVQGKGGTFTRKQWVRASEEQTNIRQAAKQDETTGKQTSKKADSSADSSNSAPSKLDGDTVISAMGDVNQGVTKRFATPGSNNIKNIAMNISGKKAFMKLVNDKSGTINYDDKDNGTGGKFTVNGHKVDFQLKGKKLVLSFDSEATATSPADTKQDEKSSWKSKIDAGNFTDEQKNVLQSGLARDHAAVVEKDGKILTSKDWDEAKYAESKGWKRVGSLTDVINSGSVSGDKTADKDSSDKQAEPSTDSKRFIDLNEFLSGKILNGKTPKVCIVSFLNSGVSRNHLMSAAKEAGITWKENENEGINWMRASMAIQKHVSEASSAHSQTTAQTDSQAGSTQDKQDNKTSEQATKNDSSSSVDSQAQSAKSDTTSDNTTDYAKELGVDDSSMSAWDDKTLTSLRDTFNQSIVNMIQARDTAKRQAEMYYKSGNDTLRKQCEEMSATYDKQADKYISAMLVVTKELVSRQSQSGNTSTAQSK